MHDAARTASALGAMVFSEDVEVRDESGAWARIAVHGPEGASLLSNAGADDTALESLNADLRAVRATIA
ncbi:MAG: hypothetical protein ACKOHI_11975, partial [Phycisphaerales bacterium]